METLPIPRLPRRVEEEADAAHLAREIEARCEPLWTGSVLRVARTDVGRELAAALKSACSARRIVRGLEAAERALVAEARGLAQVDRKTGVARGSRVSRLLLVSNDAAERFYRNVESLVRRHHPRVLGLRVTVDESELGALLFGPDQVARALLVEHKDAVSKVLLALAADWRRAGGRS